MPVVDDGSGSRGTRAVYTAFLWGLANGFNGPLLFARQHEPNSNMSTRVTTVYHRILINPHPRSQNKNNNYNKHMEHYYE